MDRRRFVVALGGLLAAPMALAQTKVHRVGILGVGVSATEEFQWAKMMFTKMLADAGYEDGRNIEMTWRAAEGDAARLPALAAELVRMNMDVIVASFNPSIAAVRATTRTIPVVMFNSISPVEMGFVQSLARPGGNATGTAWSAPETMGKMLGVLKEAAPRATRVAMIGNPDFPGAKDYQSATREAGKRLGLDLQYFAAVRPEDITTALQHAAASKAQAVFAVLDTVLVAGIREIAAFALKRKLISMSNVPQFVDAGGLLYYGPDLEQLAARTVSYVARILGGAKPGDLPVELPSTYRMIVNKRTAAAIGHRFSQNFLLQADRVVE